MGDRPSAFVDLEKIQGFGTEGYWAQCVNRNILEVFGGNVHLSETVVAHVAFTDLASSSPLTKHGKFDQFTGKAHLSFRHKVVHFMVGYERL